MAPNGREEMRRMRQRGAGSRQIKTGGSAFSFGVPAPVVPRQSSRKTPQPPSTRKTPKALTRGPSSRKTPGTAKKTPGTASAARGRSTPAVIPNVQKSGKKTPESQPESLFVTPSVTGKRKRAPPALISVAEDGSDELDHDDEEHRPPSRRSRPSLPPPDFPPAPESLQRQTRQATVAATDELEGNDENHIVQSEKRRRISLETVQQIAPIANMATGTPLEQARASNSSKKGRPRKALAVIDSERSSTAAAAPLDGSKSVERGRRRTRQSLPVVRPLPKPGTWKMGTVDKIPSSPQIEPQLVEVVDAPASVLIPEEEIFGSDELSTLEPIPSARRTPAPRSSDVAPLVDDLLRSEDAPDELSAAKPKVVAKRGKQVAKDKRSAAAMPPPEAARPSSSRRNLNTPARLSTRPRPAQHNKHRPLPKPTRATNKGQKRARNTDDDLVPITVYRLRKPTVTAEDNTTAHTIMSVPQSGIPAVNAIDVLAQITSELSSKFTRALDRQRSSEASSARRSELKRKRAAVQLFSEDLADRLFDLTTAVDTRNHLKARLRAAIRERAKLRTEWQDVRARRHEVKAKIAKVRREHQQRTEQRLKDAELNEMLCDIEVAVKRGRDAERMNGDGEEPVRSVWGRLEDVANGVGERGMLGRIKAFNGVLENAAVTIEGNSSSWTVEGGAA